MADFDLNVDNLIQRLLENYKKQKAAEENAQKLLIAQHLLEMEKTRKRDEQKRALRSSASSSSKDVVLTSTEEIDGDGVEDDENEQKRLLEQYTLSPFSETLISEEGDQITVHHPREDPRKSKLKLRDFFVAEFGTIGLYIWKENKKKQKT